MRENNKGMALKIRPRVSDVKLLVAANHCSIMWSLRTYKPLKMEKINVCSRPLLKRTLCV